MNFVKLLQGKLENIRKVGGVGGDEEKGGGGGTEQGQERGGKDITAKKLVSFEMPQEKKRKIMKTRKRT